MATKTAPPWLNKKKKPSDPEEPGENAKEERSETPAQERAEDKAEPSDKPSVKRVRDMVAAHSKVPPAKRPGYRKAVIAHARKCGAMQHIPPQWTKKG